ncbi:DUF3987 domain-containing protein [Caldicellulosiruptor acetigenus]|uniref:DUF3987 domain-containing protein n=1 Tax=Caldicellulosiruptor acetigenus 6A TaxID=632516 RepID=G2PX14_9FIRM|nr:DUF3987 domain-containing protein [Caldicellulosiruptor acetigenus]AEM72969.1 hypothetical protein Calla_0298 [Caldicellulosiruptor acetigenus 6A]
MENLLELENYFYQNYTKRQKNNIDEYDIPEWPKPLSDKIYSGIIGEVVDFLSNYTEAGKEALLLNFITLFGNYVGKKAWLEVGGDKHYPNLFTILVGSSSTGRKGSSWNIVKKLWSLIDEHFILNNVKNGASSGEGIVYHVRDEILKWDSKKGEYVVVDPGVKDKRMLIFEPEFAEVLRVMKRDGNTLSALLRNAWDGNEVLETLTKNNPVRATFPHISIIGHITFEELKKELTQIEKFNGFANRFLWVCTRRGELLPNPPLLPQEELGKLAQKIKEECLENMPQGLIIKDKEAEGMWAELYKELITERENMEGDTVALINRGEAHILRLSLIYALLDRSSVIKTSHIESAKEIWEYCENSVKFIFGGMSNKYASFEEKILEALREKGPLSQSEIIKLFDNRLNAKQLEKILKKLSERKLITSDTIPTVGRPKKVWKLYN